MFHIYANANEASTHAEVALDVGHSIKRPGATSFSGVPEFQLNRKQAEEVAYKLHSIHVKTRIIGADGKMDQLRDRTKLASEEDFFISLHHDSIPLSWMFRVHEYSGFSLFVSRKNPKVKESLICAQKIGKQLISAGFYPSRYHALPVDGQNRPYADEALGVHYFDDLIVLKTANQPAVLIESGVIVNKDDEQKVTSPIGRKQVAEAITLGVYDCLH